MERKLLLIDGNSIINRAFYGVPDLTNQDGLHTNAIYGFLNIMFKVAEEENPSHMLVAFDMKAPTFRHKMYGGYKGTRKPMPEELSEQLPVLKELLEAMNIKIYSKEGIEADDILGTMAKKGEKEGFDVSVLSGDRDLLQIASDHILVRVPKTKGGKTQVEDYRAPQVIEKFGVTPAQIIDLKGLMGDSSDNIPGVPGVGEKTAVKILSQFGTVEKAIQHVDEIVPGRAREAVKNNVQLAKLSKSLAAIKTDCRLGIRMEDCGVRDMFNEKAYEKMKSLGFKSMLGRFDGQTVKNRSKDIEKTFRVIKTISGLEDFFGEMEKGGPVGIRLVFREKGNLGIGESGQMTLFMTEAEGTVEGAAVSAGSGHTAFVETGHDFPEEAFAECILRHISADHPLVANNIKGLVGFFGHLAPELCFDTNIAAYLLDPVGKSFQEEDIAEKYAGIQMPLYSQLFGKSSETVALSQKREEMVSYLCFCALVNALSFPTLKKELKRTKSYPLFEEVEMPLAFTLYDMEKAGILVKKQALKEYGEKLGSRITEVEQQIYGRAGETFNLNSPKQLGAILFEKMRMPYGKKTKTGYSTSAEVLEKLRFEDPIVEMVLEYRQLAKLKSTYADGLDAFIDEKDGRIHTNFNQTVTATGRLSSTEPNLQNIPIRMELGRQIRKVFVPEDGYIFLDADYSQIELRVLAHMSGDERLIQAYKDNADVHRSTASLVFHIPYDEVDELHRRRAKAVNFGIVYGISGFGLSRDLGITKKEAQNYIEDYFETYPGVKKFMDDSVEKGKKQGYVSSMFGRRRPIPELSAKNHMQRQFGERVAMNSPIQGTAADIIKIAMNRVNRKLRDGEFQGGKFRSRLILQIHDELLIETYIPEAEKVAEILQEEMVNACDLLVPLIAEVKRGSTWYGAKE